jgi:release factor glutamine methyltransferase
VSARDALAGSNVDAARRILAARLRNHGIETPELDARLLIGAALGLDHTGLATQARRLISRDDAEIIEAFAQRRIAREPVARIVGRKEFWGLDLDVSAATLVPRPDTETVIEAALAVQRDGDLPRDGLRMADIGTGSGAILLALLSEWPDAHGIGTDISAAALAVARENARRLGLDRRAGFVRCEYAAALRGPFDLIVSNPPYIPSAGIAALDPDVRDYDPRLALDGGADGLAAYRVLAPQAAALLAPGGALVLEIGAEQGDDVSLIVRAAGLAVSDPPRRDLAGRDRVVIGWKTSH